MPFNPLDGCAVWVSRPFGRDSIDRLAEQTTCFDYVTVLITLCEKNTVCYSSFGVNNIYLSLADIVISKKN